jgi:hypothetical protein
MLADATPTRIRELKLDLDRPDRQHRLLGRALLSLFLSGGTIPTAAIFISATRKPGP